MVLVSLSGIGVSSDNKGGGGGHNFGEFDGIFSCIGLVVA
jgi:hypothetical protein